EKRLDLLAAVNELGAVPPDTVDGIAKSNARGIASVPGIFGETRLLRGRIGCERGQWWTGHGLTPTGSGSSVATHRDAIPFKRAASTVRRRRRPKSPLAQMLSPSRRCPPRRRRRPASTFCCTVGRSTANVTFRSRLSQRKIG